MRTVSAGVLAMAFAFAAAPGAQQPSTAAGVVEGRVATGTPKELRPLRRARVTLGGETAGTRPRIADTDAKGIYRFENVGRGDHRLWISKPGFLPVTGDRLPPGGTFILPRAGAIEGLVLDTDGDPFPSATVRVETVPGGTGTRMMATATTDDLGRYRVHSLAPGDYIVEATAADATQSQVLLPGEKSGAVPRTFYPAAESIDTAKPITVAPAQEITGIDLRLSRPVPTRDPNAPPPPPRPDATGSARIAGRVTDAVTGKPVRDARLLLVPLDGMALTNWKRSDAQGRFEYAQLQARRYRLTVSADRFVQVEYGQKRPGESGIAIQVRDGEEFKADVALPRGAAIEGLLFDEFGDPAPGISVRPARQQFVAGRHRLVPLEGRAQTAVTDDRGRYRIGRLEPGQYYVMALSGIYVSETAAGGFGPTYYPGVADAGAATPLTLNFGADANATFALSPARTVEVSGRMVDAEGAPVTGRGSLMLFTRDSLKRPEFHVARGGVDRDGTFMLRNVPEGSYTLQGFGPPPEGYKGPMNLGAMPFGAMPLTVGNVPLDDVVLRVTDGTTLRGKVVLDDPAVPPPPAQTVRVTAIPVEFDSAPMAGGPPPSETRDDLTFEVGKLSGLRRILVNVASPNWALKKITLNGIDVTDTPVDFRTKDMEGVEVLLTPKVSRVSGTVSDDKGPIPDYAVVIFASDPTKWTDRSRFVLMARPTQQGRFELRGLPPDEYLAIALPGLTGQEWTDPDFLQQLRSQATTFLLGDGESRTLELKLKKKPI
jgi:hypothetical protein